MERTSRRKRRLAGLVSVRLGELDLRQIPDIRGRRGRRWRLPQLLSAALVGLVAGCNSLREMERLTADLPRGVRKTLGLGRRVPDTTVRAALVGVDPGHLRERLQHQIRLAWRRKSLRPVGLPCGVVSVDGRGTSTPMVDGVYAQRQHNGTRLYGVVRTITCCLISARARACIDAVPIPAATNESGAFADVFAGLLATCGASDLFEVVMGDAAYCTLANATLVHEADRGYIFQLKTESQPTLAREALRQFSALGDGDVAVTTSERVGSSTVTRRMWITTEMAGWDRWPHLRTVLRVQRCVEADNGERTLGEGYFVSNLPFGRFKPDQWMDVIRRRWAVENACHNTFDRLFGEDDHPWIHQPQGMLAVMLLRRIAYNALAIFRTVTQRGDDQQNIPWRELMQAVERMLITATDGLLAGLRTGRAATIEA